MKTELNEESKQNAKHWCTGFMIPIAKPNKRNSDEEPELTRKRRYAEEFMSNKKDELDKLLGY